VILKSIRKTMPPPTRWFGSRRRTPRNVQKVLDRGGLDP